MHKFYEYLKKAEQSTDDWKQKVAQAKVSQLNALRANTRSWQDW